MVRVGRGERGELQTPYVRPFLLPGVSGHWGSEGLGLKQKREKKSVPEDGMQLPGKQTHNKEKNLPLLLLLLRSTTVPSDP